MAGDEVGGRLRRAVGHGVWGLSVQEAVPGVCGGVSHLGRRPLTDGVEVFVSRRALRSVSLCCETRELGGLHVSTDLMNSLHQVRMCTEGLTKPRNTVVIQ